MLDLAASIEWMELPYVYNACFPSQNEAGCLAPRMKLLPTKFYRTRLARILDLKAGERQDG